MYKRQSEDTPCSPTTCSVDGNAFGQFGYCCAYRQSGDVQPTLFFPTGEWYCLNKLNGEEAFTPTWNTSPFTCENIPPVEMVHCCYDIDPFGNTTNCVYTEASNCSDSFLSSPSGCGISNVISGTATSSGAAPSDSTECQICSSPPCSGAEDPLVNCCFNQGQQCLVLPSSKCVDDPPTIFTQAVVSCGYSDDVSSWPTGTHPVVTGVDVCSQCTCSESNIVEGEHIFVDSVVSFDEPNDGINQRIYYVDIESAANTMWDKLGVSRIEIQVPIGDFGIPSNWKFVLKFRTAQSAEQFIYTTNAAEQGDEYFAIKIPQNTANTTDYRIPLVAPILSGDSVIFGEGLSDDSIEPNSPDLPYPTQQIGTILYLYDSSLFDFNSEEFHIKYKIDPSL